MGPSSIPFYRYYFDLFLDFIFKRIYKTKSILHLGRVHSSTINVHPLTDESATSLAKKIRKKQLTCEQVVRAFVQRCKNVNEILNAIVDERYSEALLEARSLDLKIERGIINDDYFASHPLLGIPFTVAENLPCEGMSWTLGLLSKKDIKAKNDAEAVVLMKEAGAILIGVTNIPQLGFWSETYNPIYGFTRNPYETYRSVGRSCGGEASIVAACGSPIGIGMDIGGCLRIPANRCGVFAHKSSSRLISIEGNPLFENENTIVVIGPIVKYAEDLSLVLSVLANVNISRIKLEKTLESTDVQFFYSLRSLCGLASPIRKEVEENMKRIVRMIELYHSETKLFPVEVDETIDTIAIWAYKLSQEMDLNLFMENNDGVKRSLRETVKYLFGKRDYCLYTIYNLLGLVALKSGSDEHSQEVLDRIKHIFLDILEDNCVLLFPTEPLPLGYPYQSLLRPHNNSYCSLWNALEFPVTQVPIGLNDGLPFGVQVVAAPYKDHLCIAAAKILELLFGGYTEPNS